MGTGLLISFEGVDGSGKSTQLARLAARLRAVDVEPLLVREPGGTQLGEQVRELLLDPETGDIDPAAEALLYAASRAELVATCIEPALDEGRVVLVDRYVDSSLAYQGAARGLGIDAVRAINDFGTGGLVADRTLLLRVDPASGRARQADRGEAPDRLEREGDAFFAAIARAYDELAAAAPHRFSVLDGTRSPAAVLASALDALGEI